MNRKEEIKQPTKELLKDKLTGITFKAEVGTSYNGAFLIEPTEVLEG